MPRKPTPFEQAMAKVLVQFLSDSADGGKPHDMTGLTDELAIIRSVAAGEDAA
jgi:hypothetical protein